MMQSYLDHSEISWFLKKNCTHLPLNLNNLSIPFLLWSQWPMYTYLPHSESDLVFAQRAKFIRVRDTGFLNWNLLQSLFPQTAKQLTSVFCFIKSPCVSLSGIYSWDTGRISSFLQPFCSFTSLSINSFRMFCSSNVQWNLSLHMV